MNKYSKYIFRLLDTKLIILFLFIFLVHILFVVLYSGQKLLEQHSFRQTQTALTSFWICKEGFSLDYKTPVVGYPWSIPFEFPVFQILVALIVNSFNISLDTGGRLISALFFWLSVIPIIFISLKLKLGNKFILVFLSLLFSSPLYFFWSRTFMIESTALFFSLMFILFFVRIYNDEEGYLNYILFFTFASFAILQKSTTALSILLVLFISIVIKIIKTNSKFIYKLKKIVFHGFVFLIPILIGTVWVFYTDRIKEKNLYGHTLTSKSLKIWNFGNIHSRYSSDFAKLFIERIFNQELGYFLGLFVIVFFVFSKQNKNYNFLLILFSLFILPLLIFTPLHIVHSYYQFSCVIFLIAILAYSISYFDYTRWGFKLDFIFLLTLIFVSLNYYQGSKFYIKKARRQITEMTNDNLAVAKTINRYTQNESSIIVFGKDWGSEIPYYSERKAFMVPYSFSGFKKVLENPDAFMGGLHIDAFVFYLENNSININQIKSYRNSREFGLFPINKDVYLLLYSHKEIYFKNILLKSII